MSKTEQLAQILLDNSLHPSLVRHIMQHTGQRGHIFKIALPQLKIGDFIITNTDGTELLLTIKVKS